MTSSDHRHDFANHEVVTIAVYLLRGDLGRVDTEDIAMKANEIAPGRFSWRKYPSQVNLDAVRKRLWDATRADKGGFLVGSEKDGWALTERGVEFASRAATGFDAEVRAPLSLREKQWKGRERERMLASHAFQSYTTGTLVQPTAEEGERFFRIDEHVSSAQRRVRVERALVHFGDDQELGELVRLMAAVVERGQR